MISWVTVFLIEERITSRKVQNTTMKYWIAEICATCNMTCYEVAVKMYSLHYINIRRKFYTILNNGSFFTNKYLKLGRSFKCCRKSVSVSTDTILRLFTKMFKYFKKDSDRVFDMFAPSIIIYLKSARLRSSNL